VIDPVSLAVDAVVNGRTARVPLVFVAGALTSVGPCMAPRYLALAALSGERRRLLGVAVFVSGLLLAYSALGFGVGLLAGLAGNAAGVYAVLAVLLVGAGLVGLVRTPCCEHDGGAKPATRLGALFSMGAASGLVVSPCCTPVVAMVGMLAFNGDGLARGALLAAFALGHTAPLFLVGAAGSVSARTVQRWGASPAAAIVSGTLLLALGAYYGLLA